MTGKSQYEASFKGIFDFIFPPVCLTCNRYIVSNNVLVCQRCLDITATFDFPFCSECHEILENPEKCPHCNSEASLPVFALGNYIDPLKELIHRFKFSGYHSLGEQLGQKLTEKHGAVLQSLEPEYLIPIPLTSYRQKKRGFNQAALLADIIGKEIEAEVADDFLVKTKRTADQARLNSDKRRVNIKGAYEMAGQLPEGSRVAVVDDVITTGSTMNEAIGVLKLSGLKPVALVTLAVAGF